MPYKKPDLNRIVEDPQILVGKPTIKGTRISVELVVEQLAYNLDLHELFAAYPDLTEDDVRACLGYAARLLKRANRARMVRNRAPQPHEAVPQPTA